MPFKFNPGPMVTVILVILFIVIGITAVWYLTSGAPHESALTSTVIELLAILIILSIAYAILKAIFHYGRLKDGTEKELEFKDLPKDAPDHRPEE